jgi:hypothetical protein
MQRIAVTPLRVSMMPWPVSKATRIRQNVAPWTSSASGSPGPSEAEATNSDGPR